MILMPDLFSFAYVPNWYSQLDMLAEMALPEPWRFKNPIYLTKNPDTPILERYIHAIFKKQLIDYKDERNHSSAADYFHIENEFCCFHILRRASARGKELPELLRKALEHQAASA